MGEWISVKKELPKEGESVLVTIEDLNGFDSVKRTVRVGRWSSTISGLDGRNHYWEVSGENGQNAYRRITAWKPLDEPYVPEDACAEETQKRDWISVYNELPDDERKCIIQYYTGDDGDCPPHYAFAWFNHLTKNWIDLYSSTKYGDDIDIFAWAEMPGSR